MKKHKSLLTLLIGLIATAVLTGCGCSKDINPTKIEVDKTSATMFVGNTLDLSYAISPVDATKTDVTVSVNKPGVVSLSTTALNGIEGTVTVTANAIDTSGVVVTFSVKGTTLSASTEIKVNPDPEKLPTPALMNISFLNTSNKIRFKAIPKATSYEVDIDGTVYSVPDPEPESPISNRYVEFRVFNEQVNLAYDQGHIVKVRAIGDGAIYGNSDFSEEYKFIKLSQVTDITSNNGVLTWKNNELADRYQIEINGVIEGTYPITNSYRPALNKAGSYEVRIKASHDITNKNEEGYYVFEGAYSEKFIISKLGAPALILNNDVKVNNVTGFSKVTWNKIDGATSYNITISPALKNGVETLEVLAEDELSVEINENFLAATAYQIKVTPVGNAESTFGGETSIINVTPTLTVSNFRVENNILSFNGVAQSGGYELILSGNGESKSIRSSKSEFNLAEMLNASGTYTLSVRTIGLNNSSLKLANSQVVNSEINITKLASPKVTSVTNSGVVNFEAINGSNNYQVYLDGIYVNSTTNNSFALNFANISSGEHIVKVQAIGDGVSTISSGLENAVAYEFSKLPTVTAVTVLNNELSFETVDGAINFSIRINDGAPILNGVSDGTQTYKINNHIKNGVNYIRITTVGDNVKNISSDEKVFEISRLNAPQNLRVENGKLVWDKSENVYYLVYVGNDENGVKVTTNEYSNISEIGVDLNIRVVAVSENSGYLNSDYATLTVNKLNKVSLDSIKTQLISLDNLNSNYKLVWGEVSNASSYDVKLTLNGNEYFYAEFLGVTDLFVNLPNNYVSGVYTATIKANGNTTTSAVGYINSEIETFNFTKFDAPTNIKVTNGLLTWEYLGSTKPASYTVGITEADNAEVFVEADATCSLDLSAYSSKELTVRVRSCGNGVSTVTGEYSEPKQITHLDKPVVNATAGGEIYLVQQDIDNIKYNVYLNNVLCENVEFVYNYNLVENEVAVIINIPNLTALTIYDLQVEAYLQGYLNSEKSDAIKISKLPTVENFVINNGVFSWDAVANAAEYEITNNLGKVFKTNQLSFNLAEFNIIDSGIYNFNIRALSNGEGEIKYINSEYNIKNLTVALTPAPVAKIQNSKLILTPNSNLGLIPYKYKIEILNADNVVVLSQEIDSSVTSFDLAKLSLVAGVYTIKVYSVGNDKNIIALNVPTVLENIEKIDNANADLKIREGIICWTNTMLDAKFDVYLSDGTTTVKKLENYTKSSAVFNDLIKGKAYDVFVVIKQNGKIDSDLSSALNVTKLPDITGLKIINSEGVIKFSWNSIVTDSNYTDVNKFYYEVSPVQTLEPFNGRTEDGSKNTLTLNFDYPNINNAEFKIRAVGSTSENVKGYLNGDLSVGTVGVTKLESVSDVHKNENNMLTWTNNSLNATGILLTFTKAENNEVKEFNLSSETTSFDVTKNLDAGVYSLSILTLGNIENGVLNSKETVIPSIEVLAPVTNIITSNGYLNWSLVGDEVVYEIYADGVKLTFEKTVLDEETGENITVTSDYFSNFNEALIINDILESGKNINIKIRSKKLDATEGTITFLSKFSEEFTINKLTAVSDLHFENNLLTWSPVPNATGYVIKVANALASEIFIGDSNYDITIDGIRVVGDAHGTNGYELPTTIPSGVYEFYVAALGSSTSSMEQVGYLSGSKSNSCNATFLAEPLNLRVENGVIKWDPVVGALKYKVIVKQTIGNTEQTRTTYVTGNTSEGLDTTEYGSALYSVTVVAMGNGTTILNSHPRENSIIKVYKPKAVENYKVVNGFIYWEMSFSDDVMMALNNNEPYDDEIKGKIVSALTTGGLNETELFDRFEFLYNIEATINGIVFTNMHPYNVELSSDSSKLQFSFDFNFTETGLRNPYTVKVRYLGSGFKDPIVLAAEGEEGGNSPVQVSNFVNGVYSKEITGYKLPAPQTPIVNALVGQEPVMTMVKNNKLYFMSVDGKEGFDINYLITAISQNTFAKITKTIKAGDEKYYAKDNNGNILSSNVYCVPVSDLKLGEAVYLVSVRAVGTPDSDNADGSIYFTSNYNNTCSVQLLTTPNITFNEGKLAISTPSNAREINLRIWDVRAGETFDINKNNETEGIVVTNIVINNDTVENNAFLDNVDGYFHYDLSNNPLFTDGKYYVQVVAEGDGISQVSSKESTKIEVFKTTGVQSVTLREGKFTWDAINYVYTKTSPSQTIKALGYKIEVFRSAYINGVYVENSYESVGVHMVKASDVTGTDSSRCYFDLPSNTNQYPAGIINEAGINVVYKYSAEIRMIGTITDDDHYNYGVNVVSSDSAKSREYARLNAPINIRMENGRLIWNAVNGAVSYEVYMLDVTYGYPENEQDINYGIITNGDYRELNFEALNLKAGKIYSLIIRALTGGSDTEYLNGEFSPEIYTRKLEQPVVRIEDGVVKWNVTELDLAVATLVNIRVTGPEGFTAVDTSVDINNMVNGTNGYNLSGSDEKYPKGEYTISVSFSGSNGKILLDVTDPAPEPEQPDPEPEEPEVPVEPEKPEEIIKLSDGEEGDNNEEKPPVFTQDSYCWFSSDETTLTATKLETLKAESYTYNGENYIRVKPVDNAKYYTFTVVKRDVSNNIIKTYTTNKYLYGTIDNPVITVVGEHIMYNLSDVADYDEKHAGENVLFGTEFSVYAQAFSFDSIYNDSGDKYIISNPSEEVFVEVPVAPSNLRYEYPGTITWDNYSTKTYTRVKVEYLGSSNDVIEEKIYDLKQTNVTSFKLKDIGVARVSVLSYIPNLERLSPYTTLENPISYLIYSSGNGSQEKPYIINDATQLSNIKYNMDCYFELGSNITYASNLPVDQRPQSVDGFVINGVNTAFTGSLNGNNYTVDNINFTDIKEGNMAFIHTIGSSGVIKNLNLKVMGTRINATNFGGLAIYNNGTISNVTIKSNGNVTYNAVKANRIAGVVTYNNGTINNTINEANFINENGFTLLATYVSGITTQNRGNITYSGNRGTLSGVVVGGISSYNQSTISKCYNTGALQAQVTVDNLQPVIGGIAAYNENVSGTSSNAVVTDCYAIISSLIVYTKNTINNFGVAGGIVGGNLTNSTISNSYVVINESNSIGLTNSKFGIILGSSSPILTSGSNYNYNTYLLVKGGNYQTYGLDAKISIASSVSSKEILISTLTTSSVLQNIYKVDENNINNGYPVFK